MNPTRGTSTPPCPAAPLALDRALAAAILAAVTGSSWLALSSLAGVWQRVEHYGHGFLIPLVSLLVAWDRRSELRAAFSRLEAPAWGGLAVAAIASLQALFLLGDALFPAGLCIPLLLASTAWALGGWPLLRPLRLPLAFLVFMVPPPGTLVSALTLHLKLFVTGAAVGLLQLAGYEVAAEGSRIQLPGQTLFVADACSGLTAIVTLMPLGVVVAWFRTRGVWRRAVVLASILPLAVAANIARVVGTVAAVSWIGVEAAEGALHEGFGLGIYVLGSLALLGVARGLR